jgi:hypothetical protein
MAIISIGMSKHDSIKGRLQALPADNRLGYKWPSGMNNLAYYSAEMIAALKSLTIQAPWIMVD